MQPCSGKTLQLYELQKKFTAGLSTLSFNPKSPENLGIRYRIYFNNHKQSLIKVLKKTYFVCCRLLGEECFRGVASLYIANHPSQHFSLNHYGQDFPQFLSTLSLSQELPYLKDLTQLEWMLQGVLLSPDPLNFDYQAFSKIPPEDQSKIIFHLSPGCLLETVYPVDLIWEKNQEGYLGEEEIILEKKQIHLWISRKKYDLSLKRVNPEVAYLLKMLERNLRLEQITQEILENSNQKNRVEETLNLIPELIRLGYIGSFSI